jgi:ion channel
MVGKLLISFLLLALCVVIHAAGASEALRRLPHHLEKWTGFWWSSWLFILLAGWMVLLHLLEITAWAVFYEWLGAIADLPSALYFSAVTYTTTGYGDIVLPLEWRLVGGVEALTGILMCGWSTGFFFAVVVRLFDLLRSDGPS